MKTCATAGLALFLAACSSAPPQAGSPAPPPASAAAVVVPKPESPAPPTPRLTRRERELLKMIQQIDCKQDEIAKHNREHPDAPWADVMDIRREIGGERVNGVSTCPQQADAPITR